MICFTCFINKMIAAGIFCWNWTIYIHCIIQIVFTIWVFFRIAFLAKFVNWQHGITTIAITDITMPGILFTIVFIQIQIVIAITNDGIIPMNDGYTFVLKLIAFRCCNYMWLFRAILIIVTVALYALLRSIFFIAIYTFAYSAAFVIFRDANV